jgi:hypothetical protein
MITNLMCTVKHDPPNTYGDCFRACVASLLSFSSINDVPHFYRDGDDNRGLAEFKGWLSGHASMRPFYTAIGGAATIDDVFAMMAGVNADIEYLLFCQCGGENHVLICKNDKIIHDPSWYRSKITGPCDNGYWVIMVLVPMNP